MLQRSVTLMRRLSCARPNVSTSGLVSMRGSLNGEHALERDACAAHHVFAQFHARFEIEQRIAQLLERVQPHIRALAAVAVLVGDEIELLFRSQLMERVRYA